MAEIKAGNNIKKQVDAIEKQQGSMKVLLEQAKSKCTHTKNGDLDIVPSNNRQTGELKYICRKCRKEIDLKKIAKEDLENACNIIDRAIDVIKLQLDPSKESDEEILKKMAKTQFRVRNDIVKTYGAALQKNNRGNGNRDRNNGDSTWNKPTVNGR